MQLHKLTLSLPFPVQVRRTHQPSPLNAAIAKAQAHACISISFEDILPNSKREGNPGRPADRRRVALLHLLSTVTVH